MAQFIKVASTTDLAPGEAKCVEVAGKKIALFNLEGSFYAIDNTCTHLAARSVRARYRARRSRARGMGPSTTSRPAPYSGRQPHAVLRDTPCASRDRT